MTNSADTTIGQAVEYLGGKVLTVAESFDDNALEAQARDAVALVITGQPHEPVIEALPHDHPLRLALSEFAVGLQALLDHKP